MDKIEGIFTNFPKSTTIEDEFLYFYILFFCFYFSNSRNILIECKQGFRITKIIDPYQFGLSMPVDKIITTSESKMCKVKKSNSENNQN